MSSVSASPLTVLLFLLSSAFFLFSVNGCPPHELHALYQFKSAFNDTQGRLTSWKGHNCCEWDGVDCLGSHVSKLDLYYWRLSSVSGEIPLPFLLELKHLKHLDLSGNEFRGEIPSQLGGLSSLRHLGLSCDSRYMLTSHNLQWLSNLSSLEYLSLRVVNVSDKNWASIIGGLLHLKHLDLRWCSLSHTTIPSTLKSLPYVDLGCKSSSNIPTWMLKLTSLTHLALPGNNISGSIHAMGNLTGLEFLDLSHNDLTGPIPDSLSNLLALETLELHDNQLQGNIPASLGNLQKLARLDLSNNHLSGSLPLSFALMSSLSYLDVSGNSLNGNISSALMGSSSLVTLDLSNNDMNETITEVFFQKFLKLEFLHLSHSGLSINISLIWIPPFQLKILLLKKCRIGGPIPSWISTQFSLDELDLSGTQLTGNLPSWLWNIRAVRLSDNHLQDSFTPTSGPLSYLDLSMNELTGPLPADIHKLLSNAEVLILAENRFEGKIPSSFANFSHLRFLDMSNNCLMGKIPASLGNLTYLAGLHLQNNYLEAEIPKELGSFSDLRSLRIGKNRLQGALPSSLRNLSNLQVLDVGENNLTGSIPHWIANFSSLSVLVMRSSNFRGILPPDIGRMPQLRVLDLSSNFFSGAIPHSYLRFPAMQKSSADGELLSLSYGPLSADSFIMFQERLYIVGLSDSIDLIVKGNERHYERIYLNMVSFDLSNNRLSGPLPSQIDNLKGLMYLNLSRNSLSGPIPHSLGNLLNLESVDLSFNNFSGKIPYQIGYLTYLAHLNLSHNNLCGRIPLQGPQMLTFDKWSYIRNPDLWGCPLEKNCSHLVAGASPPPAVGVEEKTEEGFEYIWYWMCFGLSVGLGFSAVVVVLVLNLRCRAKCFQMMDRVIKEIDISL